MRCYRYYLILLLSLLQFSCEDFVEVDTPNDRIISQTVFSKDVTANSAIVGIYNQLFQASFSSGLQTSITVLSGLSADNLKATVTTSNLVQFQENEILEENSYNLSIWSSAYNIIYMTNAALEGLENNLRITSSLREKLIGEAKFIRAFTYFYLVNLYGEIPLVLSTSYQDNSTVSRSNEAVVYTQIIGDLENAILLLGDSYEDGERLRANSHTAKALLSRVHLHLGNWNLAEEFSTQVIEETNLFELIPLNEVFLANSKEAIWQISPLAGGSFGSNTNEGSFFIMQGFPGRVALTEDLLTSFDTIDARPENWIGSFESGSLEYFFPYKYKIKSSIDDYSEYSMVMRLAEQYLIRAEARVRTGKDQEAIEDLNKIRLRANLNPLSISNSNLTTEQLLNLILQERRRELFTEWGHRWLDLKRTGKAAEILSPIKSLWQSTDVLYPIPEDELRKNPNLTQNAGY